MNIAPSSLRQIQNQFGTPPHPSLQSGHQNNLSPAQQHNPPPLFLQAMQNHGRQSFPPLVQSQVQYISQMPLFPTFFNHTPTQQQQQQLQQQQQRFFMAQRENPITQLNLMEVQQRPDSLEISYLKNEQEFMSFIETFADKDNYFCQICHNLLWQPISCNNCSKIYCRDCLGHWVDSYSSCPTCRERFELKKVDKSIMNNLSKLVFTCNAQQTGCTELIGYDQLFKHQQTCGYQHIQCKNIGCDFTSIRKEMEEHNKLCEHFQLKCQWCERSIKRMNESQHQEICEMKILGCENQGCTVSLTRTEMNKHISECPFNIVRCDMCNSDFKLKDITDHKFQCDFKIMQCRGCKQSMYKKQIVQHEDSCEEVELQCPDCTDVIQRKHFTQHDQITCLKRGQKILLEGKAQLLCENACLKKDVDTLKLCVAQLYEQIQDLLTDKNERRNSIMKILKPSSY